MNYKVTFLVLLLSFASVSHADFDEVGAPRKVSCDATVLVAKRAIKPTDDINSLLSDSEEIGIDEVNPFCDEDPDRRSGTCEAIIKDKKLYLRYAFNTQNGNISLDDKATGLSTYQSWFNQYRLTKSGYLTTSLVLTSLKGGLTGNPRAFRVEFNCTAMKGDW